MQKLFWKRVQLKCRTLFRLKLNNTPILHAWMWMWHYIGAFMWKTDVSLFLSRLAGTVVWRESQLSLFCVFFPHKLASFSFKLSFNPVLSLTHWSSVYPLFISAFPFISRLFFTSSLAITFPVSLSLISFPVPYPCLSLPLEVMLLSAHSCIKQLALIISWQHHKK